MPAAITILVALLAAARADAITPATFNGSIAAMTPGRDHLQLIVPGMKAPLVLKVANTQIQKELRPATVRDDVQVVVDDASRPTTVTALNSLTRPLRNVTVAGALLAALVVLWLAASAILRNLDPRSWILGFDKRYSNSQTQLALWFGAVATIYVATNFLRSFCIGVDFVGGISLTTHLTALTGFSAFTFGAAKMITSQKAADAAAAQVALATLPTDTAAPAIATKPPAAAPSITDLVENDASQADLGDLEMIMITLAAVAIFICQSFWWLTDLQVSAQVTLPDVDGALLSGFGLGQGAYLFKKAALPLGKG